MLSAQLPHDTRRPNPMPGRPKTMLKRVSELNVKAACLSLEVWSVAPKQHLAQIGQSPDDPVTQRW